MRPDPFRLSESDFRAVVQRPQNAVESGTVIAGSGDMFEWFGGGQQAAGMHVTPETAMRSTAVWRCVTLIAGAMMSLSTGVYERLPDGGKKPVDHAYNVLLQDEPHEEMSGPELIELSAMAVLLRGNGYALIRQARNGTVTDIEYYHPARVMPFRSTDKSIWYRFTNFDGSTEDHHNSYVIHFKGAGRSWDGLRALSPISFHAQTVGIGLATRDYTAGQFERGLLTNDYFQFAEGISDKQREDFKEYLRKRAQGIANAHNPLIIEKGGKWERVGISAKDAQLLELLQYSVVDIARIFGAPPHMVGETSAATSWGTGIEQMGIGFVRYTVMPHMKRFAKEMSRKLFPIVGARGSKLFVDFDDEVLLSGDAKAQSDFFKSALGGNQLPGWMSPNEVRRRKNLPPDKDGDKLYKPDGKPAAKPAPGDPQENPDDAPQAA